MTIGKSQFLCHLSDLRNQSSFEHAILCLAIVCSMQCVQCAPDFNLNLWQVMNLTVSNEDIRGCKQRGGWSFYTILCTDSTQHSNIRRLSLISIAKEVFWSRLLLSGGTEGLQHQLTLPSSLWWRHKKLWKCGVWNGWWIFVKLVTLNLDHASISSITWPHHTTVFCMLMWI